MSAFTSLKQAEGTRSSTKYVYISATKIYARCDCRPLDASREIVEIRKTHVFARSADN